MIQPLRADPRFNPCPVDVGDELFPNGIFVFNVSKILEHLEKKPTDVEYWNGKVNRAVQGGISPS